MNAQVGNIIIIITILELIIMKTISIIIIWKTNIDLPPDTLFDNKKGESVQSNTTLYPSFNESIEYTSKEYSNHHNSIRINNHEQKN